jgi:uncharacterized membrane protein
LLWFNFAHLFSMSLLPFSTAWMAASKLSPQPVAFYAIVFFLVNLTYTALIWELTGEEGVEASSRPHKTLRLRSMITLGLFATAALVALASPLMGLAICLLCLAVYLRPEPL